MARRLFDQPREPDFDGVPDSTRRRTLPVCVAPFEAQVLTEAWQIDDNNHRPQSAHGWLTPVKFVERWVHGQQLQLA